MKCAKEIVETANYVNEMAEKERFKIMYALKENTIEFCEQIIAPLIEKNAKKGLLRTVITVGLGGEDWEIHSSYTTHEDEMSILLNDKKRYADGRISRLKGNRISFSVLENYLKLYYYEVERKKTQYDCYGQGRCDGYDICIIPIPEC